MPSEPFASSTRTAAARVTATPAIYPNLGGFGVPSAGRRLRSLLTYARSYRRRPRMSLFGEITPPVGRCVNGQIVLSRPLSQKCNAI
jgi:hypothetical protein